MSSDLIKLGSSVSNALCRDKKLAKQFLKNGYHLDDNYKDNKGGYLFTSAWVVFQDEFVFEDFSEDPDWFGIDYACHYYNSIDISKAFMYDASVIEPFLGIDEDDKSYTAYSVFDGCLDLLDKCCPRVLQNRYKWSKPFEDTGFTDIAFDFGVTLEKEGIFHIKEVKNNIVFTIYDVNRLDSKGKPEVTRFVYKDGKHSVLIDSFITNLLGYISSKPYPVKEVYFMFSEDMKSKMVARVNPDMELTITAY